MVLEALHAYNMKASDAGLNAATYLEMASDASVAIDCTGGSSKPNAVTAPTGRDPGSLPPKVISPPMRRVGPINCQIQAQPQAKRVQLPEGQVNL